MDTSTMAAAHPTGAFTHPYAPVDTEFPHYVANTIVAPVLVAIFASGCATIALTTRQIAKHFNPTLSTGQTWITIWFAISGCIHFFFEGYFAYNNLDIVSKTDVFGQLWKEYSLSDSRYLSQDPFTVCMETVTAVCWGPLCFIIAYCIITDHPARHFLQTVVSLGQLYGDVLYFATCSYSSIVLRIVYCRPESFYFWMYYVFCNGFWIIIPAGLILQSGLEITAAFKASKKAFKGKKAL